MIHDTRLDIDPVEQHDVVEYLQMVVFKLVYVQSAEVNGVAVFVSYLVCHRRVADVVAVAPYDFCVTITFRVVGHAQRCREVELSLLEVIAEGGLQRQIAVRREGVSRVQLHLVRQSPSAVVSQVERVDDGRQVELCHIRF